MPVCEETELIIFFQNRKHWSQTGFTAEFYQSFKKETRAILYNLREQKQREYILTLFWGQHSLISKPDKTLQENYRPIISAMNTEKILIKILANWIQQCIKKIIYQVTNGIYPRCARLIQHLKINVIYLINRQKRKISHDHINKCRKSIWQIHTVLLISWSGTLQFDKVGWKSLYNCPSP